MEHMGLISLLPPIIAVILAMITKNVIISLFSGVYVGVLILVGGRPLEATMETIGSYLFPQVADSYHAAVLVLLFFIGGFVELMEKSGGGAALASKATNFINTRAKAQVGSMVWRNYYILLRLFQVFCFRRWRGCFWKVLPPLVGVSLGELDLSGVTIGAVAKSVFIYLGELPFLGGLVCGLDHAGRTDRVV